MYERNPDRRGYANGYKSKTLDTTAGTVTVDVPKAAGIDEPSIRSRWSAGADPAIAEMYVQGVSTRDAAKVMAEFGLKSLSSAQVSRAALLLDEELATWRRSMMDEEIAGMDVAVGAAVAARASGARPRCPRPMMTSGPFRTEAPASR